MSSFLYVVEGVFAMYFNEFQQETGATTDQIDHRYIDHRYSRVGEVFVVVGPVLNDEYKILTADGLFLYIPRTRVSKQCMRIEM